MAYKDCYYKETCSFAHGSHELRGKPLITFVKYKTKPCKSFTEEGFCSYGYRCQYCHTNKYISILKNRQLSLLTFKYRLSKYVPEILNELVKEENNFVDLLDSFNLINQRRQYKA